jgi:hypothetical protein
MLRAVQRTLVGFEASYRRHLATEQRRAVLDALAQSFDDESTVGQIVDAAAALGYLGLGDLSLADLADALLTDARASQGEAAGADQESPADDDDDAEDGTDDDEEDDEEVEAPAPRGRGRPAASKATPTRAKPVAAPKGKAAKPAPVAKPVGKPAAKTKPTKISLDDRMSLGEAADVLLPLVRALGQATMQQLEQSTAGAGRRKLRFHIGQLVRNGHLQRHGMGRGTYYTAS